MISNSQPLRSSSQGISLTKSANIYQNQFINPQTLIETKKRIETKQSMLSQTLKSSIISDSEYNSEIYQWRKTELSPIVRVLQVARRSEIDERTGYSCTHNTIKPQPIFCKLSNFHQFSKEELLFVLKNLLQGHQSIYKKMKATSVSLQKCVLTMQGHVKVWVNQHFQRNDISGQILNNQGSITKRILEIISFLAQNNPPHKLQEFFSYVNSSMKKGGKWTFLSLKAMLKSYCDCLRLKIPKQINMQRIKFDKRPIQSSLIQNKPKSFFPRSRQNSFQLNSRNIQSSLNYSGQNLQQSHQFLFDNVFLQRAKSPTCRDIDQKITCSTLKSLASKTRHTSSISQFKISQDCVIEKSNNNFASKNDFLKIISNVHEHRKFPSINDVLVTKIGFGTLPQVNYDEQCSSPSSAQKSNRLVYQQKENFSIQPQYNLTIIERPFISILKPTKQSSISTTNQTSISGNQFCFSKKIKESHITINLEDNKENNNKEQFRTASRDRFKQNSLTTMTQQPKKAVGSCTNWSNNQNSFKSFDVSNFLKQIQNLTHESKIINKQDQQKHKPSKMQIQSSAISFQNIIQFENQSKKQITPMKTTKNILKQYLKNPLSLLNQLKSQQEIQSFQNTQKSQSSSSRSPSLRKLKLPIEQKILELLSLNKKLVISTYMQTNSQKKILEQESPQNQRQKKLKDIEQTLSELVKANLKQQEILEGNCWTKKLQNLLQIEQELKQSISFGPQQANALLHQIKLSKLGKWGRQIGNSVIPEKL